MTIQLEEDPRSPDFSKKLRQNIDEMDAQAALSVDKDISEALLHYGIHILKTLVSVIMFIVGLNFNEKMKWVLPIVSYQILELVLSSLAVMKSQKGFTSNSMVACCVGRSCSLISICLSSDPVLGMLVFMSFCFILIFETGMNCVRIAKALDQTFFIRMVGYC